MDQHTLAAVSLMGICLDVLGSLYLAYDLLGGQHGPLRLLTRIVTYSIVFGFGYGIGLGILFGIVSGTATGITVAIELQRTASSNDHYSLRWEAVFSAIRGAAFGAGLCGILGCRFGIAFGTLITAGQILAYARGMRPGLDYAAFRRPRFSRRHLWGVIVRTAGYIATALLCGVLAGLGHIWLFALRVGLVTGVVTGVVTAVNPFVEYYADNLPPRRLGMFGVWLLVCGFVLQSFQYWVTILGIAEKLSRHESL